MEAEACATCGVKSNVVVEDRLRIRDLQSQIEGYVQYGRDVSREYEHRIETLRGQHQGLLIQHSRCSITLEYERLSISRLVQQWQKQLQVADREKVELKAQLNDLRVFMNKINLENQADIRGTNANMTADELWVALYTAKDEVENLRRETLFLRGGQSRMVRTDKHVVQAEYVAQDSTAPESN